MFWFLAQLRMHDSLQYEYTYTHIGRQMLLQQLASLLREAILI
jgi:hypothetical protein